MSVLVGHGQKYPGTQVYTPVLQVGCGVMANCVFFRIWICLIWFWTLLSGFALCGTACAFTGDTLLLLVSAKLWAAWCAKHVGMVCHIVYKAIAFLWKETQLILSSGQGTKFSLLLLSFSMKPREEENIYVCVCMCVCLFLFLNVLTPTSATMFRARHIFRHTV